MTNYSRSNLLTAIQMYDFYMYDLQLYLDTHPTCPKGLAAYEKYKKLSKNARRIYTEKFGPLTPEKSDCSEHFAWVNGPWPWERSDC